VEMVLRKQVAMVSSKQAALVLKLTVLRNQAEMVDETVVVLYSCCEVLSSHCPKLDCQIEEKVPHRQMWAACLLKDTGLHASLLVETRSRY